MLKLLGEGTYGKVYRELRNEKEVAVKYIKSSKLGLQELGEVNTLLKFHHPNIMRLEDLKITRERIAIVMPIGSTEIDMNYLPKWVHGLLSGLYFMHKNGYIHGDIKHDNILIINGEAVISDFSISTRLYEVERNTQASCCKNPQQIYKENPSLFNNPDPIMHKPYTYMQTDIWALGCTIFYIINNMYPFHNLHCKFLAEKLDIYIKTDEIEGKQIFKDVIKTLLNPDPDELSINVLEILTLDSFENRYSKLTTGTFVSTVENQYPVIFDDELKSRFEKMFTYLFSIAHSYNIPTPIIYNAIDIFYRIFTKFLTGSDKKKMFIYASICLVISCKVYAFPEIDYIDIKNITSMDKESLLDIEIELVDFLGGFLDRDISAIPDDFKTWIIKNIEKF
jgi:serine/threonine protein kinase